MAPKAKAKSKAAAAADVAAPKAFEIDIWLTANVTRAKARAEPKRKNFVSNVHKRSLAAATLCGVDDVQPITKRARDAAGEMHDSLHKKK